MTEPCMFPNLHEPFYCRIHADVRLRLTDERCRRGVTLTQPQPDAGLPGHQTRGEFHDYRVACVKCGEPGFLHVSWRPEKAQETDALTFATTEEADLRSTPAAPDHE